MAGNSKRKRKPVPKGIGTRQRMVELFETGLAERSKKNQDRRDRNLRLTKLPLGHPMNVHVLDEHERTGTHMFTDDGQAVMWVERDQCYTPIVDACFELHRQFEYTAGERGWGDVPPGLMGYGAKLARGVLLDAQDIQDARATVQWMRDRLSEITCWDWVGSMNRMEAQDKAQAELAA